PDWRGLLQSIERRGMPDRVHHIELFLDEEIQDAICAEFNVLDGLDSADAQFPLRKQIALQSFLGYDFVRMGVEGLDFPLNYLKADDTAELSRDQGRNFVDENTGPITTWDEYEAYPWPDPETVSTASLEWYSEHLPENMCIMGSGGFAHFAEFLTWLMGYSTFCMALYEQRDLVAAIAQRLVDIYLVVMDRILAFDRVKILWGSDDMGYRGGPLASPADLREFVLPGHKLMAEKAHAAGRPYLLHSCGNLDLIMDDLIDDVGIDAKHSFEDTIELVTDAKAKYGDRIALLGGIDLDFLCRASEEDVRARVRQTLEVCMVGGGYCLGTGNSVANYVPVNNYLAMLDEGRRFATG
ncbi:MAG: uroporphyrinogen-III decarboxylase-like protein, partial [bacterium]|nr:uroporphyrinogen-III decarboxylase-like protein [bacterium]